MPTTLLALDTSEEACSVALLQGSETLEDFRVAPRQHTELLIPMVEGIMAQAGLAFSQLDAIAFGRGPGSFVGIRIGAAVTQGLAYSHQLPVVPVSSLAALAMAAHTASGHNYIASCIDARMDEIYGAVYHIHDSVPELVQAEVVTAPAEWIPENTDLSGLLAAGSGWRYQDQMPAWQPLLAQTDCQLYPRAGAIAQIAAPAWERGEYCSAFEVEPTYLRTGSWKKKTPAQPPISPDNS